ncbi:hypothetical protein Scep_006976 [Stephania cephalantha]|uniref:Uncharacterized protein n=1 Tax=Stephania cephalantha TaxID=152367 RepID=A0AAP0KB00_9MAGN
MDLRMANLVGRCVRSKSEEGDEDVKMRGSDSCWAFSALLGTRVNYRLGERVENVDVARSGWLKNCYMTWWTRERDTRHTVYGARCLLKDSHKNVGECNRTDPEDDQEQLRRLISVLDTCQVVVGGAVGNADVLRREWSK